MKKFWLIAALLLGMCLPATVHAETNAQVMQQNKTIKTKKISERNGILLDVARYPMTVDQIYQVIDQINPQKFNYLVLHLNDNEQVAFKSKYIGNQKQKTGLTVDDLKEIVDYAARKQIMIVPDFDTPGHCTALIKLIKQNHPHLAKKIVNDAETLDFSHEATVKFVEKIYHEINQACANQTQQYMFMGGDEVAGGISNNRHLVRYFNQLNAYENKRNVKTIVWNDAVGKHNNLNKKITIAYWSQSGNTDDKQVLKSRAKSRATVSQLDKHPLINANSEYNYLMMDQLNNATETQRFINEFNQNQTNNFNEINQKTLQNDPQSTQKQVKSTGQLVCLWEGNPQKLPVQKVIEFVKNLSGYTEH